MTWSEHIISFTNKAKKRIHLLSVFKYSMSRYALFRCYLSFLRPLLEYAVIIFDNCFKKEKFMIENLQYAALRLVTGAKKRTSRELLWKDCGLCTMQNRRTFHKLLKFFSIINHQWPSYQENCLPILSGREQRVTRSRTCKHFRLFYCTSEQFRLSFLPSSVSLWNKLPANIRSCTVLSSFKPKLLKFLCVKTKVPMQFYIGDRTDQINLCQIRLNFSSVNDHLYTKSCIESPSWCCSAVPETPQHYFFDCLNYQDQRQELFSSITNFLSPDYSLPLKLLLRGSPDLTVNNNVFLNYHIIIMNYNGHVFCDYSLFSFYCILFYSRKPLN